MSINVNTDKLRNVASDIKILNNEIDVAINSMKPALDNLGTSWTSKAGEMCNQRYLHLKGNFKLRSEYIGLLDNFLSISAESYENHEKNLLQIASEFL